MIGEDHKFGLLLILNSALEFIILFSELIFFQLSFTHQSHSIHIMRIMRYNSL